MEVAPLGVAHKENGGYRVSGPYRFGSGCSHAEFMGDAAMEMHDGEMPPFDANGLPLLRAFIVPVDRVTQGTSMSGPPISCSTSATTPSW